MNKDTLGDSLLGVAAPDKGATRPTLPLSSESMGDPEIRKAGALASSLKLNQCQSKIQLQVSCGGGRLGARRGEEVQVVERGVVHAEQTAAQACKDCVRQSFGHEVGELVVGRHFEWQHCAVARELAHLQVPGGDVARGAPFRVRRGPCQGAARVFMERSGVMDV